MKGIFNGTYLLLFLFVFLVSLSFAQPVMLTDSLSTEFSEFAVVEGGVVVFINSNGIISSVSIDNPFNVLPFSPGWSPTDDGWESSEDIEFLKSSPDGTLLCLAFSVSVPDTLLLTEVVLPHPILILVCNSDGSDAQIVGLMADSPNGLSLDFTQDSRLLYGSGFLPCLPTPDAYFAMHLGDESSLLRPFDIVDIEEGARFSSNGILQESFIANPWSDLVTAGYSPLQSIADMSNLSILYEDSNAVSPVVELWIEPDAGLTRVNQAQTIRFADGTVYNSQEEPFLILGRISENNYIFSRNEGESIRIGSVNWSSFEELDTSELTELSGYITINSKIKPLSANARNSSIVFSTGRGLYYYEF